MQVRGEYARRGAGEIPFNSAPCAVPIMATIHGCRDCRISNINKDFVGQKTMSGGSPLPTFFQLLGVCALIQMNTLVNHLLSPNISIKFLVFFSVASSQLFLINSSSQFIYLLCGTWNVRIR